MKYCKTIISFVLVFAMILTFSIPAFAEETEEPEHLSTFWDFLAHCQETYSLTNIMQDVVGAWDTLTDSEKTEAYNDYVSTLPSTKYYYPYTSYVSALPSSPDTLLSSSDFCVPVKSFVYGFISSSGHTLNSSVAAALYSWFSTNANTLSSATWVFCKYWSSTFSFWFYNGDSVSLTYSNNFPVFTFNNSGLCSVSVSIYGTSVSSAGYTAQMDTSTLLSDASWNINYVSMSNPNYTVASRPAGLVTNCTITSTVTNEDNSTTTNNYNLTVPIIDDLVGVDVPVFTDPLTGVGINLNNWWYDYLNRRYNFTYDSDGTDITGSVTYGDTNITIVNGDTTTIYNYPSPEPEPEPEPTPDTDVGWLEAIYNKVCEVLSAILGLDTSPTVNVDTATNTDIVVNVPSEDDEDRQFKLTDFKDKFSFLGDIYDIVSCFIGDVSGDSQAAYMMSSGEDVALLSADGPASSGSGSTITGSGSAAPAISIDFGSANSHYGYNYGGSMSILDLSWYTQYKPTVDGILSGFLWIFFIWACFKHAPSIISGGDLTDNKIEDIKKGSK